MFNLRGRFTSSRHASPPRSSFKHFKRSAAVEMTFRSWGASRTTKTVGTDLKVTLNLEPFERLRAGSWNFEPPPGFERLEPASVLYDSPASLTRKMLFGQKASAKLLDDPLYAILRCQIKKLPRFDPEGGLPEPFSERTPL